MGDENLKWKSGKLSKSKFERREVALN